MCGRPGSRLGNNAEPSPRKAPCSPRHGASASLTDGCQDEKLLGNEIEIPVANAAWCAAPLRNKGMTDSLAAVLQLNRETRNSKRECPKMRHQQVTIGSRRNDISRKKADGKRLVRLQRDED